MPRPRRRKTNLTGRRKSKAPAKQEDAWYSIREILDEKVVNGKVEYLVDWEPDQNGRSYTPTWSTEVTEDALKEWESRKKADASNKDPQESRISPLPSPDPAPVVAPVPVLDEVTDSDEDQSPLPAHRRRLRQVDGSSLKRPRPTDSSPEQHPSKLLRLERSIAFSDEPVPSVTSTTSLANSIEGSLSPPRTQEFLNLQNQTIAVEIPKDPELNPLDYQFFSGTQDTQATSQSLSELEQADNRFVLASQLSQGTVPDSQDISTDISCQHPTQEAFVPNRRASGTEQVSGDQPTNQRVVPDSQDPSLVCPSTSERRRDDHETQVTSNPIQKDPIIDSSGSNIPSRQLDDLSAQSVGVQDSPVISETPAEPRPVPETVTGDTHQPPKIVTSSAEPVFLTQPEAPLDLSRQQDSSIGRFESSDTLFAGTSGVAGTDHSQSQGPAVSILRESQAAQIVNRDFDQLPASITDSNISSSNPKVVAENGRPTSPSQSSRPSRDSQSATDPASHDFPAITPSRSSQQLQRPRRSAHFQYLLEQLSQIGTSRQSSPVGISPNMSSDMKESAVSQTTSSAVDELRQFIDFGSATHYPPDTELDATVEGDQRQQLTEPSRGDQTALSSADEPQSNVLLGQPQMELLSQPIEGSGPWNAEGTHTPELASHSISPASIMNNPSRSAVDTMRELVDLSFSGQTYSVPSGLVPDQSQQLQTTISPAEISRSAESEEASHTLLPLPDPSSVLSRLDESSGQSINMGQVSNEPTYGDLSLPSQTDSSPFVHFVTLPFQASTRSLYDDTLVTYKAEATEFGRAFSNEIYRDPDQHLVDKIDELFNDLINICDYPQDITGTKLEELPPVEKSKFCCDANPKFNFTFELLRALDRDTEILIVARTRELLSLLFSLTEALEIECVCDALGKFESKFQDTAVRVTFALSKEKHDPFRYEVVIGFDHSFTDSPVSRCLSTDQSDRKPPLIMLLVTTHSIEHITHHVPQNIPTLDGKNALLSGIVQARQLIQDPERGYGEPHEAAEVFSDYLNGNSNSLVWEPQPVPDFVLDIYVGSQPRSQIAPDDKTIAQGNVLKRKLDDSGDEDDAKRMRPLPLRDLTINAKNPPLSDAVQELLRFATPQAVKESRTDAQASVSLRVLESLAEQFAEHRRRTTAALEVEAEQKSAIGRLEKQVKEFTRTSSKMSESYRQALQDRSLFEKDKRRVEEAAKRASEEAKKESDKLKQRINELETTVTRLTAPPDGSTEESPLTQSERLLQEAEEKLKVLEKRLANAHKDGDYVRTAYQNATTSFTALQSEKQKLEARNTELEQKASDNLMRIHQIQRDETFKELYRKLEEQQTQCRELHFERDRALEELQRLKTTRRETRQGSVPRSPRMGVMSPRPGARGFASGSASRGTSPAPAPGSDGPGQGMQFIGQQAGNGRWGHLRD